MHRSTLKTFLTCLSATVWLASAAPAEAQCQFPGPGVKLYDGGGFQWDIGANGQIGNGTSDAFDGGMALRVNGAYFLAAPESMELSGRQVVHGPSAMSGLNVTRRVYVPKTERWARFIESFENPTGLPINVSVRIETNVGSEQNTVVTDSSSVDTSYTVVDGWVATDDGADGSGDPSLNHNYWGSSGPVTPSAVGLSVFGCPFNTAGPFAQFDFTVDAYSTALLIHFAGQNRNRADASANALMIDSLESDVDVFEATMAGVSDQDLMRVVNWFSDDLDHDGVPNVDDVCLRAYDPNQEDSDGDGFGDLCDNCPITPNADGQHETAACILVMPESAGCGEVQIELVGNVMMDGHVTVEQVATGTASSIHPDFVFQSSELPKEIDISTLVDDVYDLCVSAVPSQPASIDSISFEILNSQCGGRPGTYEFFLNGASLGSVPADPNPCICDPPVQIFTVSDAALLANWHAGGANELGFTLDGNTLLSWVAAETRSGTESHRACLFSFDGRTCDGADLCDPGYVLDLGTLTGSTTAITGVPEKDCVDFTKAGEQKLMINGKCSQPPAAFCRARTVSAGATCDSEASIDDGSFDPDGGVVTLTQTPAGPYPEGMTPVTLTVANAAGETAQCEAMVTVRDDTPPVVSASLGPVIEDKGRVRKDRFLVGFEAHDNCDATPSISAELLLGGCPSADVSSGQVFGFKHSGRKFFGFKHSGRKCQVRVKHGISKFKAADLSLSVTATDASGNSASEQAAPGGSSVSRLLSVFEGTMLEMPASKLEKKLAKLEKRLEKWMAKLEKWKSSQGW